MCKTPLNPLQNKPVYVCFGGMKADSKTKITQIAVNFVHNIIIILKTNTQIHAHTLSCPHDKL